MKKENKKVAQNNVFASPAKQISLKELLLVRTSLLILIFVTNPSLIGLILMFNIVIIGHRIIFDIRNKQKTSLKYLFTSAMLSTILLTVFYHSSKFAYQIGGIWGLLLIGLIGLIIFVIMNITIYIKRFKWLHNKR